MPQTPVTHPVDRFWGILDQGRRRQILLIDEIALGVEDKPTLSDEGTGRDGTIDSTLRQIAASSITELSDERALNLAP